MLGKSLTYESPKGFEILHSEDSEDSKELYLNLTFQLSRAWSWAGRQSQGTSECLKMDVRSDYHMIAGTKA